MIIMFVVLGFMLFVFRGIFVIGMLFFYMIFGIVVGYVVVRLWRIIGCGD